MKKSNTTQRARAIARRKSAVRPPSRSEISKATIRYNKRRSLVSDILRAEIRTLQEYVLLPGAERQSPAFLKHIRLSLEMVLIALKEGDAETAVLAMVDFVQSATVFGTEYVATSDALRNQRLAAQSRRNNNELLEQEFGSRWIEKFEEQLPLHQWRTGQTIDAVSDHFQSETADKRHSVARIRSYLQANGLVQKRNRSKGLKKP